MEFIYEYGVWVGFWCLYKFFISVKILVMIYGVVMVLVCVLEQVCVMQEVGWEIVLYGLKWVEYKDMFEVEECVVIVEVMRFYEVVIGEVLWGWYMGCCLENIVWLVVEIGGFDYILDIYDDDLFYWCEYGDCDQLIIFYMFEINDMWFVMVSGWVIGQDFFIYFKDVFDVFYEEGCVGVFKMMSIGLYCCFIGWSGKIKGFMQFIDYI